MTNSDGGLSGYQGDEIQAVDLCLLNLSSSTSDPDVGDADKLEPNYALFSVTLILLFLVVIGNSVTVFIFLSTRKLFDQTALCLVNLAIADFLTGVVYLPMSLSCLLNGECLVASSRPLCLTMVVVSYTCYGASACTLSLVSIDRCIKISLPFRYHAIVTRPRMVVSLAVVWAISFAVPCTFAVAKPHIIQFNAHYYQCGLQAHYDDALVYTYIVNVMVFLVPVTVMTLCNMKILMIALQARKQIASQEAAVSGCQARRASSRSSRRSGASDMRVAMRVLVVVIAFIICFLPFNIQMFYARRWSAMFPSKISLMAVMMVEINSAINPVVYVTTYAAFRSVIAEKLMVCCRRSGRRDSIVWTVSHHRNNDVIETGPRLSAMSSSPDNLGRKQVDGEERTEEQNPFITELPVTS